MALPACPKCKLSYASAVCPKCAVETVSDEFESDHDFASEEEAAAYAEKRKAVLARRQQMALAGKLEAPLRATLAEVMARARR